MNGDETGGEIAYRIHEVSGDIPDKNERSLSRISVLAVYTERWHTSGLGVET